MFADCISDDQNLLTSGIEKVSNLKRDQMHAFSSPFKLVQSYDPETRKEQMNTTTIFQTDFNLTDSKINLVKDSTLPRTATHIYSL